MSLSRGGHCAHVHAEYKFVPDVTSDPLADVGGESSDDEGESAGAGKRDADGGDDEDSEAGGGLLLREKREGGASGGREVPSWRVVSCSSHSWVLRTHLIFAHAQIPSPRAVPRPSAETKTDLFFSQPIFKKAAAAIAAATANAPKKKVAQQRGGWVEGGCEVRSMRVPDPGNP